MNQLGFTIAVAIVVLILAVIFPTVVYFPFAMPACFLGAGILLASTFRHTSFRIKLAASILALLIFTLFAQAGHDQTGVLSGALLLAWASFFAGFGGTYLYGTFKYRGPEK